MKYRDMLKAGFTEAVQWRRHLHRHPELSYQETKTANFVAEKLRSWGLEVTVQIGGGGVTGLLKGALPGPTIALRADMDALPIQDAKSCDYASTVPGVMHACGHDAHTSALLLAAKVLSGNREHLEGSIKFMFQHAEEQTPGGAAAMIEDGVLDDVDAVYGVHLWTPLPAGHVYCTPGPMMAAADEFTITIKGKGGHGGLPHQTVDAVMVSSQLVVNLQTIVSRGLNPLKPAVVTVGSFHGGTTFNIIAETCTLKGTVRTFDESTRIEAKERLEFLVHHTCTSFGASSDVKYVLGYPPVVNDPNEASRFRRVADLLFGEAYVQEMEWLMAGEDFAYYLQKVPGCFMIVGAGDAENGITAPHHHPQFDIAETSILQAAELLTGMALDGLKTIGKA
ncbi:M20 metallopeptidase family protein [Paenibacillus gansuensis]|uniref:M20 family metallopeptidase n=1 Tax=Paenibacillus gansuensis TaxID=306542 RepID=A0ABW5PE84_9BACL